MTELESLECTYVEMYKDVYGVKARWYRADTVEQVRADLERLEAEMARVIAEEKEQQEAAVRKMQVLIADHCEGDFEKAIRWQHQACDTEGDDEYLEYVLGLPYGWIRTTRAKIRR